MPLPPGATKEERQQYRQLKRSNKAAKLLAKSTAAATAPTPPSPEVSAPTVEKIKKAQKLKGDASTASAATAGPSNVAADEALRLKKALKKEKAKRKKSLANSVATEIIAPASTPTVKTPVAPVPSTSKLDSNLATATPDQQKKEAARIKRNENATARRAATKAAKAHESATPAPVVEVVSKKRAREESSPAPRPSASVSPTKQKSDSTPRVKRQRLGAKEKAKIRALAVATAPVVASSSDLTPEPVASTSKLSPVAPLARKKIPAKARRSSVGIIAPVLAPQLGIPANHTPLKSWLDPLYAFGQLFAGHAPPPHPSPKSSTPIPLTTRRTPAKVSTNPPRAGKTTKKERKKMLEEAERSANDSFASSQVEEAVEEDTTMLDAALPSPPLASSSSSTSSTATTSTAAGSQESAATLEKQEAKRIRKEAHKAGRAAKAAEKAVKDKQEKRIAKAAKKARKLERKEAKRLAAATEIEENPFIVGSGSGSQSEAGAGDESVRNEDPTLDDDSDEGPSTNLGIPSSSPVKSTVKRDDKYGDTLPERRTDVVQRFVPSPPPSDLSVSQESGSQPKGILRASTFGLAGTPVSSKKIRIVENGDEEGEEEELRMEVDENDLEGDPMEEEIDELASQPATPAARSSTTPAPPQSDDAEVEEEEIDELLSQPPTPAASSSSNQPLTSTPTKVSLTNGMTNGIKNPSKLSQSQLPPSSPAAPVALPAPAPTPARNTRSSARELLSSQPSQTPRPLTTIGNTINSDSGASSSDDSSSDDDEEQTESSQATKKLRSRKSIADIADEAFGSQGKNYKKKFTPTVVTSTPRKVVAEEEDEDFAALQSQSVSNISIKHLLPDDEEDEAESSNKKQKRGEKEGSTDSRFSEVEDEIEEVEKSVRGQRVREASSEDEVSDVEAGVAKVAVPIVESFVGPAVQHLDEEAEEVEEDAGAEVEEVEVETLEVETPEVETPMEEEDEPMEVVPSSSPEEGPLPPSATAEAIDEHLPSPAESVAEHPSSIVEAAAPVEEIEAASSPPKFSIVLPAIKGPIFSISPPTPDVSDRESGPTAPPAKSTPLFLPETQEVENAVEAAVLPPSSPKARRSTRSTSANGEAPASPRAPVAIPFPTAPLPVAPIIARTILVPASQTTPRTRASNMLGLDALSSQSSTLRRSTRASSAAVGGTSPTKAKVGGWTSSSQPVAAKSWLARADDEEEDEDSDEEVVEGTKKDQKDLW